MGHSHNRALGGIIISLGGEAKEMFLSFVFVEGWSKTVDTLGGDVDNACLIVGEAW